MKKSTIGILTNFQDFNPGHSLVGISIEQSLMLLKYGHKVCLFVNENYNKKHDVESGIDRLKIEYPDTFIMIRKTMFMHLTDYSTKSTVSDEHIAASKICGKTFCDEILRLDIDVCYTHDFIYTGWNYPYSLAVKEADRLLKISGKNIKWLHWLHSQPNVGDKDWWDINEYGENHYVVFPNKVEYNRVAESFKCNPGRLYSIPHIKDIRIWYNFTKEAWDFTERYSNIVQSDIIQVYPCSTDRMAAKQLHLVIRIFGYMKEAKVPVFLCIANQWATGLQRKEDVSKYIQLAEYVGLKYGEDFVFTSEYSKYPEMTIEIVKCKNFDDLDGALPDPLPDDYLLAVNESINWKGDFKQEKLKILEALQPYSAGIGQKMLSQLGLLSNVLIFPTKEESFGLVGPEASYAGALVVANRSLSMMYEVLGVNTPGYDFGSYHNNVPDIENDGKLKAIAHSILNQLYNNPAIKTKIYTRKRYNMDFIYNRYYLQSAV